MINLVVIHLSQIGVVMKHILLVGIVLTSFFLPKLAFASNCESACQLTQIKLYFSALDKVSRQGSSIKDIEALLTLTHDDVKYVHVEYGAKFDKGSWRKAFIRNLNREGYQNSAKNEMRVLNSIFGKNHTAIEYSHGVTQLDGSWQQTEPLLVIFGFTGGKISLIKELW
jgi:hypothetical protein